MDDLPQYLGWAACIAYITGLFAGVKPVVPTYPNLDRSQKGCDIHFCPGIVQGFFIAKLAYLQYG
jgi:hypothetical protein